MVKRALCPFCNFGCELGVIFDDFGVKGVEYLHDTHNEGRLCPRGSAAARYLDHPMRLVVPYRNGYRNWQAVQKELKKHLENPASIAITFDRNITTEEYGAITDFCEKMGIEHVASTYLEPEAMLGRFFDPKNPFSVEEISTADMILVLGDLFNQTPMISKHLINWKLSNRKNRLIVIDSLKTHTAYFANDFLKVKPGTEPLLLLALSNEKITGIDLNEITGIPGSTVSNIARSLKEAKNGLVMACLAFGHTHDPVLLAEGLARFGNSVKKKVVPFVEFTAFGGNRAFGAIVDEMKKKKIKSILNFGELFPFYYPQLIKEMGKPAIYATSTLKFKHHTQLPFALNLEKAGTIVTAFGQRKNNGEVSPASGAKNAIEILQMFGYEPRKTPAYQVKDVKVDLKERAKKIAEKCLPLKKKIYRLFGEKIAFNFLSIFEGDSVRLSPDDAVKTGIRGGDMVVIESKHGRAEVPAKISQDIGAGVLVTTAESPAVKGLFEYEFTQGVVNFIPTEVELWLKE